MIAKEQPNGDFWLTIQPTDSKVIRFPVGAAAVIHHEARETPECYQFRYESGHSIFIYVTKEFKNYRKASFTKRQ